MTLSTEDIDALSSAIAEKQQAYERPVLPLSVAMAYVGKRSESAFYRWADKWGVKPCDTGRFSRTAIDRALNKEAKARHKQ